MTPTVETQLQAMTSALDAVAASTEPWSEVWTRVQAPARRRATPLWPLLTSIALCVTVFLSTTLMGVVLGLTPTAAAAVVPAPSVAQVSMTPNETQAVRASAGPAAAFTPAPVAQPVR